MADSGPRHYQQAEKLLSEATYAKTETDRAKKLQEAQVHATLALVAATLQGGQVAEQQLREWRNFGVKL
jgi:hypothetical protein